jgi:hypothetical protein
MLPMLEGFSSSTSKSGPRSASAARSVGPGTRSGGYQQLVGTIHPPLRMLR